MSYSYVWIDGCRVEVNVAVAYRKMAAAFFMDTKCRLIITDATRLHHEQEAIFFKRYRQQSVGIGPYGDVRWYRGQRYVRYSGEGTVAPPGESNHEEDGPNGPRSLDLRDDGHDAGVTKFGTARDQWMQNNAHRFGFENEGNNFEEAWHKTYRGRIGIPVVPEKKPQGVEVIPYYRDDAKSLRNGGKILNPGQHYYLHTDSKVPDSNATNIVKNVGEYSINTHVYAEGTPGDEVDVVLLWKIPGKASTESPHFTVRMVIPASGKLLQGAEFKRGVSKDYNVFAKIQAVSTNKNPVKITRFATRAFLFLTS